MRINLLTLLIFQKICDQLPFAAMGNFLGSRKWHSSDQIAMALVILLTPVRTST